MRRRFFVCFVVFLTSVAPAVSATLPPDPWEAALLVRDVEPLNIYSSLSVAGLPEITLPSENSPSRLLDHLLQIYVLGLVTIFAVRRVPPPHTRLHVFDAADASSRTR